VRTSSERSERWGSDIALSKNQLSKNTGALSNLTKKQLASFQMLHIPLDHNGGHNSEPAAEGNSVRDLSECAPVGPVSSQLLTPSRKREQLRALSAHT
jgi:hypothetical protein